MRLLSLRPTADYGIAALQRCAYVADDGYRDQALLWPGKRRDWIVVIHGHGSREDQLYTRPDIRRLWLPALRATGAGLVTPHLRGNAWMSPAATRDLHALLAWLRRSRGARRFFFFSGSMGGSSNLYYALRHPEDVAALVALGAAPDPAAYAAWLAGFPDGSIQRQIRAALVSAYGGRPETRPAPYRARSAPERAARLTAPLFFAHGERDALMPVAEARRFAAAMRTAPLFLYRELAGGGHDAPLALAEATAWLARQIAAD